MRKLLIFIASLAIFLSLDTFAQIKPAQSQYLQEKGALVNPSFEQGYKGWTITGDCTKSLESDTPLLNKTLKLTCVNQSFSVKQNADFSSFANQQGILNAQVKTSVSGSFVRSLSNDIEASSASVIVGDYKAVSIPIVMDGTSNGVEYYSDGNVTGDFYIDEVGLRLNPNLVGVANDVDTDWIAYTPTYQGFGTPTEEVEYKRVGDSIIIRGTIDCGTTTAVEAQLSLPNSLAIKAGYSLNSVGSYFRGGTTVGARGGSILATGGDTFINFSHYFIWGNSGSNFDPLNPELGNVVCDSATDISFTTAQIPIQGWSTGRTNIVAQQTELTAKTANELSARVSLNGSSATLDSQNYSWVTSVTRNSTGVFTLDYSDAELTQAPSISVTQSDAAIAAIFCSARNATSTTASIECVDSGGSATDEDVSIIVSKQGTDVNKSQTIIGKFNQDNFQDKYSESEITYGFWNGQQLYRRCFTTGGSALTGTGTITTWAAGLRLVNTSEFQGSLFKIFNRVSGSTRADINYNNSNGAITYSTAGAFQIGANTTFCLDYTK